ncbi:MAG: hypothetical protein QW153_02010 [Candidatus Bilamarchaeaceae archaeon]
MFDEKVENALWVVDVAKGKKKPATLEEWLKVVIYSTKILRLYDISGKLNGWARYVFDKTNATLGNKAKTLLRTIRKEALSQILSHSPEEIKAIRNSLKEEYISTRVIDFEPEIRENFYTLLNIFLSDTSLKYYKLALANPAPVNVLINDIGYMLIITDNYYLPIETINEFENENDAYTFFANFLMLLLYAKEKKIFEADVLINDKIASKYVKECYRIFSKSIKDEKKSGIAELIRSGNIWDAVGELQTYESFYSAFKQMHNINLVSFAYGEIKITSFVAEITLSVDKYGLEKMADIFEKNKNSTKGYFTGIFYLNAAIQDYLIDRRVYLSRELDPILPDGAGWALPLKIKFECTADWKTIVPLNKPAYLFGIKNAYIETMDNKFISVRKAPEDFEIDPVNGSIAKIEVYSTEEENDLFKGNIMFIPEFLGLLSNLMLKGRIDESIVNTLNLNPAYRKFNFISEKGKIGIDGYFTGYITAETKTGGLKK